MQADGIVHPPRPEDEAGSPPLSVGGPLLQRQGRELRHRWPIRLRSVRIVHPDRCRERDVAALATRAAALSFSNAPLGGRTSPRPRMFDTKSTTESTLFRLGFFAER